MAKHWIGAAAILSLAMAACGEQMAGGRVEAAPASASGAGPLSYGDDPLQAVDFWPARTAKGRTPLIIFVHGGGWRAGDKGNATGAAKIAHYPALGYAFASVNYRLSPAATVEQQAQDVAAAIAFLRGRAADLGVDPARIVLMGHSAGAHLVALVGTDPRYLAAHGMKLDAVRGVIALDGAGYDVARQLDLAGPVLKRTYQQAFGADPARHKALSPTFQAGAPNAPSFLILHVDRADGRQQSQELAAALRKAGTPVALHALAGKGMRGHLQINRLMGDPDYPGTPIVDAWLARRF